MKCAEISRFNLCDKPMGEQHLKLGGVGALQVTYWTFQFFKSQNTLVSMRSVTLLYNVADNFVIIENTGNRVFVFNSH